MISACSGSGVGEEVERKLVLVGIGVSGGVKGEAVGEIVALVGWRRWVGVNGIVCGGKSCKED